MKKVHFWGCLLLIIGMTACEKKDEASSPVPSGQFVYEGEVYDLHYGSIRQNASYLSCYDVVLYSSDETTRLNLNFYIQQGGVVSGIYENLGFIVNASDQRINAQLSLRYVPEEEESFGPLYVVKFGKNANEGYDLQIYSAEYPDVNIVSWSGKLAQ